MGGRRRREERVFCRIPEIQSWTFAWPALPFRCDTSHCREAQRPMIRQVLTSVQLVLNKNFLHWTESKEIRVGRRRKKQRKINFNDILQFSKTPKHVFLRINIYNININVCLLVCLSVGMWRSNGNPNPCTNRGWNFAHTSPPVQGRFWSRFDPRPLTPWALGAW